LTKRVEPVLCRIKPNSLAGASLDKLLKVLGPAEDYVSGDKPWRRAIFIDVGSTFTKVLVINPQGRAIANATAPTTIDDDVLDGVLSAIANLPVEFRGPFDWALASSSAAGGLRMVSVGLTEPLSGRAGTLAALGSGGKVIHSEFGFLDERALSRVERAKPHLVLLAGGIDGGDQRSLLHNARKLAMLRGAHGFVVAGNNLASAEAAEILSSSGRDALVVDNVYPDVGKIEIAPTREAVRELFMRHITRAKGLEKFLQLIQSSCEPTPLAVSRSLNQFKSPGQPIVFVDLGGATTDVHSFGGQREKRRGAGVPDPEVMRTVEGDLGMRWSAPGVVSAAPKDRLRNFEASLACDLSAEAQRRHDDPSFVPTSARDRAIDRAIAQIAIEVALERHAGRVQIRHRAWGDRYEVVGKDLRNAGALIAVGGVFIHTDDPKSLVKSALASIIDVQAPKNPRIVVDSSYGLFAVGLAARHSERLARAMAESLFGTLQSENL
jgi:uncharacterized protein (TIGR01319 family)